MRDLSRLYHALPALLDRLERPEEPPRAPSKLPWIIVAGLIAIAFYGHFGIGDTDFVNNSQICENRETHV